MARRSRRRRGFDIQDAPQLQRFLLPNARKTGRTIGGGAYGQVEELDVQGLLCAGKKLHSIFFEQKYQDATTILERFVEECSLLADLRHPHIVQFLGICFLDGSDLPVLVMEYLPYCLDSLLEGDDRVELPLAMKCSILRDVALGLNHMHTRTPPVIHRDLTAKNILLSSAMTGKIADLGVARILNQQPGRLAVTMTQTPGTLAYMPPEVLEESPKYNSTIDMFSFGHLTLFTIVQDFPHPTAPVVMDPSNPGKLIACSEVQRRFRQMEQLFCQLGGEKHPLVQLVTQCLHNDPRQRPSAKQVLSQLEQMRTKIENQYEHMSKLELIQALEKREGGEGEGTQQAQITHLKRTIQAQAEELEASQAKVQQIQEQLYATQAEAQQYRSRLEQVQAQLRWKEDELTRSTHQTQAHQPPRSFKWRRGREMQGTSMACVVVVNGTVYVGGGGADRVEDQFIIQVYAPEGGVWSRLPECPVKWFAMAVLNHQLVLVGGRSCGHCDQSTVQVLDSTAQRWTTPYPNMPTARARSAAVGYQHFLVVAGGHSRSYFPTVEILNSLNKHWYTAAQLPMGCSRLTSALVGDALYLLGGISGSGSANKKMFSISLPVLISHTTSTPQAPPPTWDVTDVAQIFSSSVSVNNHLLAVGGEDDRGRCSSAIHLYNPQTRQWTKVGDMPTPLSWCSCAVLSSGELVVSGGLGKNDHCSNKVYFGTAK